MKLITPTLRNFLALLLIALLATGCALTNNTESEPAAQESREVPKPVATAPPAVSVRSDKALQELLGGIASYENGNYRLAARQLQSALALGLEGPANQARAHKYLAFMHCVDGRQAQCRDEFRKAISSEPAFDLTPAESGHPIWGPVFRKLKGAGKAGKK
jgi:Tfp pilus assembly protein PilF